MDAKQTLGQINATIIDVRAVWAGVESPLIILHVYFILHFILTNSMFLSIDTSDITQQYLDEARTYIKQNGVFGIEEFLRKKLEGSKDVKIRFGITGDSGTGKSAFINAIRG